MKQFIFLSTLQLLSFGVLAQSSTYTPGKVGEYGQRGYVAPATIHNVPAPSRSTTSPTPSYTPSSSSRSSYSSPGPSSGGSNSGPSRTSSSGPATKVLSPAEALKKQRADLRLRPLFCASCPNLEKGYVNKPDNWLHNWAFDYILKAEHEGGVEYVATKLSEATIRNLDPEDLDMFFEFYIRALDGARQGTKLKAFWALFPDLYKKSYPNGAKNYLLEDREY